MIDLHVHSTASDGSFSPCDPVKRAKGMGLRAIALTDHETVDGIPEAMACGEDLGVGVVPGVELQASLGDFQMHILGYFLDWKAPWLLNLLDQMIMARTAATREMVRLLQRAGISVSWEQVLVIAGLRRWVGINHLLEAMLSNGYFSSRKEAMRAHREYFARGAVAYVPYPARPADQVIEMIRRAGGVSVLAHPGLYGRDDLIPALVERGLLGLEAYYPGHDRAATEGYLSLASRYGLVVTGGSDDHGDYHEWDVSMGGLDIPYHVLETLMSVRPPSRG